MRPHIEFINSKQMPWEYKPIFPIQDNLKYKILSRDYNTYETSLLIKYPPGWKLNNEITLNVDEEFFVLEGAITVNQQKYTESCYGFFPAGYSRKGFSQSEGATVLTFFSEKYKNIRIEDTGNLNNLVKYVSLYEEGWDTDYVGIDSPEIASSGSRKKLLRTDPANGDQSWLMGIIPSYQESKVESHPVIQECYITKGEIYGNCGLMVEGSYFWRPRDILHGPYGSKTGCTIFSRAKGGKLIVDYYDLTQPFQFVENFKPQIPIEYRNFSKKNVPSKRY